VQKRIVERGRTPFSGMSMFSSIARNFNKKHVPLSRKSSGYARYAPSYWKCLEKEATES
jgi:hypothetical protein